MSWQECSVRALILLSVKLSLSQQHKDIQLLSWHCLLHCFHAHLEQQLGAICRHSEPHNKFFLDVVIAVALKMLSQTALIASNIAVRMQCSIPTCTVLQQKPPYVLPPHFGKLLHCARTIYIVFPDYADMYADC